MLALASVGLSCVTDATLLVAITEMDHMLTIENNCTGYRIARVASSDGERQFLMGAGKSVSVTNTPGPLNFHGLGKPLTELGKDRVFWGTTHSISY